MYFLFFSALHEQNQIISNAEKYFMATPICDHQKTLSYPFRLINIIQMSLTVMNKRLGQDFQEFITYTQTSLP
jgi:hypothetical protein